MLTQLEELAREKSSERRRELLHALTDAFFVDAQTKTDLQIRLYDDILCKIVDDVENEAKAELSNRIAPSEYTPKGILLKLASDDISVAAPVLKLSPLLSEQDLLQVAQKQSTDHLLAISEREYVSEKVSDVLIDRGDDRVHRSVASNDGVRVSEKNMQFLVTFAQKDTALLEKLKFKKVKQEEKVENLVHDLNTELSRRLAEKNIAVSEDANMFFDAILNTEVRNHVFKEKVERINVKIMAQKIKSNEIQADGIFLTLANTDQFVDIGMLISEFHDMPQEAGFECLMNKKVEPLMILLKAAGCTERAMEAVLKMRAKRLGTNGNYGPALASFSALTPDMAQRVIRFLKIRQMGDQNSAA